MAWLLGGVALLAVIVLLAIAISSASHSKLEGRWKSWLVTVVIYDGGVASVGPFRATWVKTGARSIRLEKVFEEEGDGEEGSATWPFPDLAVEFRLGKDDNEALVSAIGRDWRFERQP